ncbi:eukaryotic translation initiation factor 3 subunit K-like [Corticium candelabrum]|uniref:eukaryotic translation initiation factor 3 subunit K-like n=1 Tax=Corticium candelabrum TaxID=121492 RepID=UPI002E25D1A3|nr:eukaryotic translation initiation factor 3 subunit K-like [Corticium candelabrum]
MEDLSDTVEKMLNSIDKYNPENVGILEAYAEQQAEEGLYNFEANLAVLKLYQFNPHLFKMPVATAILLKALTNLPSTDFQLCRALIQDQYQQEEPLSKVIELANLLETCCFHEFWEMLDSDRDLIAPAAGFDEAIRRYVCHVVSITFQRVAVDHLAAILGDLQGDNLHAIIDKQGWKLEGNSVFIVSQEAIVKPKNIVAKMQFDNVASVMASSVH